MVRKVTRNRTRPIARLKPDNEPEVRAQHSTCRVERMKRLVAPLAVLAVTIAVFAMSFARL